MRIVQITLDEDLAKAVDETCRRLGITRSAFTQKALRDVLARHRVEQQERRHRRGYQRHPVAVDEFSVWELEQTWRD